LKDENQLKFKLPLLVSIVLPFYQLNAEFWSLANCEITEDFIPICFPEENVFFGNLALVPGR